MANSFDYYMLLERSIVKDTVPEIDFYQSTQLTSVLPVSMYVKYLKNRIYRTDSVSINKYDRYGGQIEMKNINIVEYSKDLNNLVYKREWIRLKDFHKHKKLREYIDTLKYPDDLTKEAIEKNKAFLFRAICRGLKEKRFRKGLCEIKYNSIDMRIELIDCIVVDTNTNKYKIVWA